MKRLSFLFTLTCVFSLLTLASCSEKNEDITPPPTPAPVPTNVKFTGLYQVQGELPEVCSEINVTILRIDGTTQTVKLTKENDYKWSDTIESTKLPAEGGFKLTFKMKNLSELTKEEYKLITVHSMQVTSVNSKGEKIDSQKSSTTERGTVEKDKLEEYLDWLSGDLQFFYKCDAAGKLSKFTPAK